MSRRKRAHTIADDNSLNDEQETYELLSLLQVENSEYKSNMLFYIAGFVVREISKSIACEQCSVLLFHVPAHGALYDHSYCLLGPYAKFLTIKNKGSLTIPAVQVYEVVVICETIFRQLNGVNLRVCKKGSYCSCR